MHDTRHGLGLNRMGGGGMMLKDPGRQNLERRPESLLAGEVCKAVFHPTAGSKCERQIALVFQQKGP